MSRSLLCTRFPLKLVQILLAVSLCFAFTNGANASTHWANLAESIAVSVQAAQKAHQKVRSALSLRPISVSSKALKWKPQCA